MARTIRKSGMKAAKVLIDRFEYRLQNDPRFLRRIEQAQQPAGRTWHQTGGR